MFIMQLTDPSCCVLTFLYAGFAFIISLVREVVKILRIWKVIRGMDAEPCRFMGYHGIKSFSGTWLVVLLAIVLIVSMYMLQLTWWIPFSIRWL
jgi:4-hydroxybenzoate polyprenyltransferase